MPTLRKVFLSPLAPFFIVLIFSVLLECQYILSIAGGTNDPTSNSTSNSSWSNSNAASVADNSTNTTSIVSITAPAVKSPTDGGSVDVEVQPTPYPPVVGDAKFKITFLQPSSATVQVHVDYDVAISHLGKEIFKAAALTGQPLLHTAEGTVTIPYKFENPGHYSMQISVLGINFIPIKTEIAKFDFDVK
jgi:hypothetical protein